MSSGAALTRRTALAAAALAPVVLTGCDLDPSTDPGSPGTAPPPPSEDAVLLGSLVIAIVRAEAVVTAARDAVPAWRPRLDALLTTHAAHRLLLVEAAPETPATPDPAGRTFADRAAAIATVRRVERRLRREVERGCIGAASGDLARVLSVMAGSLAQHAASLETM